MAASWLIPRRTLLRGAGVALALPLLDVMAPLAASEPDAAGPRYKPPRTPTRMFLLNMPCGNYRKEWGVDRPGALSTLKPMLAPLQEHASEITLFSNLWNQAATADAIPHYANEAGLWTSRIVKKTTGADLSVGGVSVDQMAARCTAAVTRFPVINLGMMAPYGGTDGGWARVYNSQLSWSTPTTPVPNEIDAKRAFDRLFRSAGSRPIATNVSVVVSEEDKKSILDYIEGDAAALRKKASVADQRKLDEYLTSVRDVEKQMEREIRELAKERRVDPAATRAVGQLGGVITAFDGRDHTARVRMMLDLAVLAFWTDSTRVATFMFGHERNDLSYTFLDGVKTTHHESSHHTEGADKLQNYRRINIWHAEQIAYLLGRLRGIKEGNGQTLLDNSSVLWAGALHDGNDHRRENLPVLLAGKGGGSFKPGRHLSLPEKTPLANLYLTMLQSLGVQTESFADSTGVVKDLLGG